MHIHALHPHPVVVEKRHQRGRPMPQHLVNLASRRCHGKSGEEGAPRREVPNAEVLALRHAHKDSSACGGGCCPPPTSCSTSITTITAAAGAFPRTAVGRCGQQAHRSADGFSATARGRQDGLDHNFVSEYDSHRPWGWGGGDRYGSGGTGLWSSLFLPDTGDGFRCGGGSRGGGDGVALRSSPT